MTQWKPSVRLNRSATETLVQYRGGNVAGQREWGWVSQQLGIPNFPQDFPDCPAGADLAKLLAAEQVSPVLLLLGVVLLKIHFVCFAASSAVESCHTFCCMNCISCVCMTGNCAMPCNFTSYFRYRVLVRMYSFEQPSLDSSKRVYWGLAFHSFLAHPKANPLSVTISSCG